MAVSILQNDKNREEEKVILWANGESVNVIWRYYQSDIHLRLLKAAHNSSQLMATDARGSIYYINKNKIEFEVPEEYKKTEDYKAYVIINDEDRYFDKLHENKRNKLIDEMSAIKIKRDKRKQKGV